MNWQQLFNVIKLKLVPITLFILIPGSIFVLLAVLFIKIRQNRKRLTNH